MAEVAMPRLSDSMEEGTILKWLKSDGDQVSEGDELVEIETDKANMTYEADQAGVLQIVAKEGDTLPVGATIAKIGDAGSNGRAPEEEEEPRAEKEPGSAEKEPGSVPEEEEQEPTEKEPGSAHEEEEQQEERADDPPQQAETPEQSPEPVAGGNGADVKASPVARRMAREMGVALGAVEGSGPGGRIVKGDVEAAAKGGTAAPAHEPPDRKKPAAPTATEQTGTAKGTVEAQDLTKLQQVIARRMAESKATAPDFVVALEVDMDETVAMREQLKGVAREGETIPSFNDFVIKAAAVALREFPRANGAYRDGRFELYSRVNVGVAVAAQDALVVPTVFDADRKTLGQIATDVRALAEKVRASTVTPPELSGGTFTVSNLGMYGMKRITPVINPPQAAILGVGSMEPRPVVRDGRVVVRRIMDLTLVCDHRILYGADAAQFLGRIKELLEQPLRLAL